MRSIEEIMEELNNHPDFLCCVYYTKEDFLWSNVRIENVEDDIFDNNEWDYIKGYVSDKLDNYVEMDTIMDIEYCDGDDEAELIDKKIQRHKKLKWILS